MTMSASKSPDRCRTSQCSKDTRDWVRLRTLPRLRALPIKATQHITLLAAGCALLYGFAAARGGDNPTNEVRSLLTFTPTDDATSARIVIDAQHPATFAISRRLFGTFTEHINANVYQGAWAQLLLNPGCEPAAFWGNPSQRADGTLAAAVADFQKQAGVSGFDPDISAGAGLGPWWIPIGTEGTYKLDAGVNGVSQRLSAPTGKRAGMMTPVFVPAHRDRTVNVELWAKTQGGARLSIALLSTNLALAPLAVATIAAQSNWTKVQARLTVPEGALGRGEACMFAVLVEGGGSAWVDQIFAFPSDHLNGWDPDLVRYLRDAHVSVLRFPGGNFVSGYHWEDGVGPVDKRPAKPNPAWPGIEWNHVGTDEWLRFCELIGAEPLICVNAGDGTPEEAAAWVRRYRERGVKFWEVGNELYGSWQIGATDARGYAERYTSFARAMKAAAPEIDLIACGDRPEWNAELVRRNGSDMRSISIHWLPFGGVPRDANSEEIFLDAIAHASAFFEELIWPRVRPMFDQGLEPKAAVDELQILNPLKYTMVEALFYSAVLNESARAGQIVELLTHSALINHGAGMTKQRGIVAPQPVHWALWLYATQPGLIPVRVEMTGPSFSSPGKWQPKLNGVRWLDPLALLSPDGSRQTLLVPNRHPQQAIETVIELSGFTPSEKVEVARLAPTNLLVEANFDSPDTLRPQSETMRIQGNSMTLSLPPHSLTRMIFSRSREPSVINRKGTIRLLGQSGGQQPKLSIPSSSLPVAINNLPARSK
jgi:alpha-L-arabinofuranosidase